MAMASVQKFGTGAIRNELRHNARMIRHNSNRDIDPALSCRNYDLTPAREVPDPYLYYQQRLMEVYCYARADVKTAAGWVITCPQELTGEAEQRQFFESTAQFLCQRYGEDNVLQIVVHYDEGKWAPVTDRWGNVICDDDDQPIMERVCGQPHLHFVFMPVTKDYNPKHMESEKVCAKEVLDRAELQHFHSDLQEYLYNQGIDAAVITGVVRQQGYNRTVDDLKRAYAMQVEMERTHDINLERE